MFTALPAVTLNVIIQTTATDHSLQGPTKRHPYDGGEYTTACNLVEVHLARNAIGHESGVIWVLGLPKHMRLPPTTNEN